MEVAHSYLILKILRNHYLNIYFLKNSINNSLYLFTTNKTLICISIIFKYCTFFSNTIFLELSAFDYMSFLNFNNILDLTLLYCFFFLPYSLKIYLLAIDDKNKNYTLSYLFNNLF